MPDFSKFLTEAYQILRDSKRKGVDFVNTELDLSTTWADRALSLFSAGHTDEAKESALAAKTAYRAVQNCLPRLAVQGKERELIAVKLGKLTHLIEKNVRHQVAPLSLVIRLYRLGNNCTRMLLVVALS